MKALTLKGGRVLDAARQLDAVGDVHLAGAAFTAKPGADADVFDATGLWVMPGVVDLRSVMRDRLDIDAAMAAGVATIVASPESTEVSAKPRMLRAQPLTRQLAGEELGEVPEGCLVLSHGFKPLPKGGVLRRALQYAQPLGAVVMVHPEDASLSGRGVLGEGDVSTRLGLMGVPVSAETAAIARDLSVLEDVGGRLHISHVTSARGVDLIRDAKRRGLRVTADAAIVHLTRDVSAAAGYSLDARVWPPLRLASDVAALVEGVRDGTIDAIAFDHVRVDALEREHPFEQCAPGTDSYRWAWPKLLALQLTPLQLVRALTVSPARIVGLPLGSLAADAVADVTIVDPSQGRVIATIVAGEIVYSAVSEIA